MARKTATRQRWRRALLIVSFIAFPVTMNYFSPYLIVDGAFNGIVNGSLVVFAAMFAGSLVLGRLWCGWACPAAGVQEFALGVNDRRVGHRLGIGKWLVWVPWIATIAWGVTAAGGYRAVDLLYGTAGGISVAAQPDRPIIFAYVIYFIVVGLFVGLAMAVGRRAGCHAVCWMAPFMVAGRWLRNSLGAWPALRLRAEKSACKECGTCTTQCPMSIDVQELVAAGSMEDTRCVLCGTCADTCPNKVIRYSFSAGR